MECADAIGDMVEDADLVVVVVSTANITAAGTEQHAK